MIADGLVRLKTIVEEFGVVIPLMFGAFVGSFLTAAWACERPARSAKYSTRYPFGTPGRSPRSIAYFTSCETTGLLQPVPPPSGGL